MGEGRKKKFRDEIDDLWPKIKQISPPWHKMRKLSCFFRPLLCGRNEKSSVIHPPEFHSIYEIKYERFLVCTVSQSRTSPRCDKTEIFVWFLIALKWQRNGCVMEKFLFGRTSPHHSPSSSNTFTFQRSKTSSHKKEEFSRTFSHDERLKSHKRKVQCVVTR